MTAARVEKHWLPRSGRTVVVSDLHGDLAAFCRLMEQVRFSARDTLVVLGDILEKGPDSLGLLRHVMQLAHRQPVLAVLGNCDDALCELTRLARGGHPYWLKDLHRYLRHQPHSIIREMASVCGLDLLSADMPTVAHTLYGAFREEMDFVAALPEVIETRYFVFVHAGVHPGPLAGQSRDACLLPDAFAEWAARRGVRFDKYCVTGHWPTCNYHHTRHSFAPLRDDDTRVIAIDGGHMTKPGGVLHALIIPDGRPEGMAFDSYDPMPRARALDTQAASPAEPLTVTWRDRFVKPMEWWYNRALCRHILTDRDIWVPLERLQRADEQWIAPDCTDYHLPIAAGSEVRLLGSGVLPSGGTGMLVRQGMLAGWYTGRVQVLA